MRPARSPWSRCPERTELRALYAEADALTDGWACTCTTGSVEDRREPRCCHFGVTGREPYPTAVELAEVHHAVRAAGISVRDPRKLPLADTRPCPLLSGSGQCRIYASRPLGCRTFFCSGAEGPSGERPFAMREAANAIGRRIADLSARFDPRDPHPRPLVRALLAQDRRA